MTKRVAQFINIIFHPFLIPTLGYFIFFHSGFYFSILSWEAKRMVLLITFFSTGILPVLCLALASLHPKVNLSAETVSQRSLPLIFATIAYYTGYFLLNHIKAYPVMQIFMLAAVIVIVLLLMLSLKWKISSHMAAFGSLTGALIALSFRTGTNPFWTIVFVIMASGITGWAQLYLNKNKLWQLEVGYITGFAVLYLVIYFI